VSLAPATIDRPTLAAVPTLDAIAARPAEVRHLTRDAAVALHAQCVVVLLALLPLLATSAPPDPATSEAPSFLTPQEAADLYKVPKRWLLTHAHEIPGTRALSRKTIRFEQARLERWLDRHRRA
jgi:hypothetical protein